ncbi:MAG: OmpA family protein [Granulosicoccus sp.]|nr:OmpA family protein [Granulosicoccus sp.]
MNIFRWVVILIGFSLLGGCASKGDTVTGTEGSSVSASSTPAADDPAMQDADQDGILDAQDACAGSTLRALVDASGCEIVTGVIEGIKFGPNETDLSVESREVLSKYVDVFKRYPDVVVAVEGHTDNRGPAADNLELSKQRVLSVVRYMVANGISADRIKPYGYGESRPRAPNATVEGREQNRRIEINIVEGLL